MRYIKKLLTLTLVVATASSVFVGCTKQEVVEDSTKPGITQPSEPSKPQPPSVEVDGVSPPSTDTTELVKPDQTQAPAPYNLYYTKEEYEEQLAMLEGVLPIIPEETAKTVTIEGKTGTIKYETHFMDEFAFDFYNIIRYVAIQHPELEKLDISMMCDVGNDKYESMKAVVSLAYFQGKTAEEIKAIDVNKILNHYNQYLTN